MNQMENIKLKSNLNNKKKTLATVKKEATIEQFNAAITIVI